MKAAKNKREIPLSVFYLKYFAFLFTGVVAVTVFVLFVFEFSVMGGLVYPAYYAQKQAGDAMREIAYAQQVDETLIPELCRYVVFRADGTVKTGNTGARGTAAAWRVVQNQAVKSGGYYYMVVAREEEYCVLEYKIVPQYCSRILRRYLPNPQNLLIFFWLCAVLLIVALSAHWFGCAMREKLSNLISVTEKIQSEELDFVVAPSDIREISAVLRALDDMRGALKDSLESQWRQEQEKREQLLALAHDLKTPLTLVRGNAELLHETAHDAQQRSCAALIEKNAERMQTYVQTLTDIMRDGVRLRIQSVGTADFLEEAFAQLRALCDAKGLLAESAFAYRVKELQIDRELFLRALVNVFSNAVTHTKEGGTVFFEVREEPGQLSFYVTDTGCGFRAEALKHAAELFFTGDKSRGADGHIGMGLYMAGQVMRQHGGKLLLENSEETGGARVCLRIFLLYSF